MSYRVFVTGHTSQGRSTLLRDSAVHEAPGWMYNFWMTADSPADNGASSVESVPDSGLSPPPAGSLFRIFHILPDRELRQVPKPELAEISRRVGADVQLSPGRRIWHRTDTIDYVVLLSGKATLHLDDNDIELAPFDAVIQRGTHHAWSNKGDAVAVAACVLLGAAPLRFPSAMPSLDRSAFAGD